MLLYWVRDALKPSPTERAFRSYINFRGTRFPLRPARFSVYASPLLFAGKTSDSARDATLDTGGWLALTRQGLSPCKAHQASLGALTPRFTCLEPALTGRRMCETTTSPYKRAIMLKLPPRVQGHVQAFVSAFSWCILGMLFAFFASSFPRLMMHDEMILETQRICQGVHAPPV